MGRVIILVIMMLIIIITNLVSITFIAINIVPISIQIIFPRANQRRRRIVLRRRLAGACRLGVCPKVRNLRAGLRWMALRGVVSNSITATNTKTSTSGTVVCSEVALQGLLYGVELEVGELGPGRREGLQINNQ
jgi:hypothetical protein